MGKHKSSTQEGLGCDSSQRPSFYDRTVVNLSTWHVSELYILSLAMSERTTLSEVITAFNILFFLPAHYFITHHESRNWTKCLVLYIFCSSRTSNIQRMCLQYSLPIPSISHNHQTAPSSALKTFAYFRCCHMWLMQRKTAPKAGLQRQG